MKILTIHADFIEFEAKKKALKKAEEGIKEGKQRVEECLVIFTAVEKSDEADVPAIVEKYVQEIKNVASQVDAKKIVLYPYAHLSSQLSNPATAEKVMKDAEKVLAEKFQVTRAPFGWYKAFTISCKGHPLSELSREFSVGISGGVGKESGSEKITGVGKIVEKELTPEEIKTALKQISRSRLDASQLKENDHRIIGQKLDLWSFNEVAPGMVFWHDKGLTIYNELVRYWREEHRKLGYIEISTPQIMDRKLWEISGHWKLYRENIFTTKYEGRDFAVKPMSCPGGMLVYRNKPRSYKELPMRVSELGKVHRLELSGVLAGLFRVIQFTQDDAHIFCEEEQLEHEIIRVVGLFKEMLGKFEFKDYQFSLSTRSEEKKDKYLGSDELWNKAEETITKALAKINTIFTKEPGEAKFYGPSLDVLIKDSMDREWQCSTIQLDFNNPLRFELEYIGSDNKMHTPIMLHHVVYGSLERFIGVLTEHLNGRFPVWLNPVQVKILTMNEKNNDFAVGIVERMKEAGLRVELDHSTDTIGKKVRNAQLEQVNYIITIGDKEMEKNTLAVRTRTGEVTFDVSISGFIEKVVKEVKERR